jgi:hypothetical protein
MTADFAAWCALYADDAVMEYTDYPSL